MKFKSHVSEGGWDPAALFSDKGHFYCYQQKLTSLEDKILNLYRSTRGGGDNTPENIPKTIRGTFDCSVNRLTSLEGAPESVENDFICSHNKLTSLKGAARKVGRDFNCSGNLLTSLEGAPDNVNSFNCSDNNLTSLKWAPSCTGYFLCNGNQLSSLEGAPTRLEKFFSCSSNKLTSLKWAPMKVRDYFTCQGNKITSLEGIGREYLTAIYGELLIDGNPIRSHILGICLIKGLEKIVTKGLSGRLKKAADIMNNHLGADVIDCQHALIEADLDEYAQL